MRGHSFSVDQRRNEAAPALARTRTPSCATRSRLAIPARNSAAKLTTSSCSTTAPWPRGSPPTSRVSCRHRRRATGRQRAARTGGPAPARYPHPRWCRTATAPGEGAGRSGVHRTALHGLDGPVQRPEIQRLAEGPYQAHTMIRPDQVLDAQRPKLHLIPLRLCLIYPSRSTPPFKRRSWSKTLARSRIGAGVRPSLMAWCSCDEVKATDTTSDHRVAAIIHLTRSRIGAPRRQDQADDGATMPTHDHLRVEGTSPNAPVYSAPIQERS